MNPLHLFDLHAQICRIDVNRHAGGHHTFRYRLGEEREEWNDTNNWHPFFSWDFVQLNSPITNMAAGHPDGCWDQAGMNIVHLYQQTSTTARSSIRIHLFYLIALFLYCDRILGEWEGCIFCHIWGSSTESTFFQWTACKCRTLIVVDPSPCTMFNSRSVVFLT